MHTARPQADLFSLWLRCYRSNGLKSHWMPSSSGERERWNRKYRDSPGSQREPDPFLPLALSEFVRPLFPVGGRALDLAGGAGRHAIWLAKEGWEVTLIDISSAGIQQAQRNASTLALHVHCVEADLSCFKAPQRQFDLVMGFFYLERRIFPEVVKAIRPGGLLIYKTLSRAQPELPRRLKDPAYLLGKGELLRLADGLQVLHYREQIAEKATAELVARKNPAIELQNSL